jgi:2-phospho-L-lactate/phosphoenolpyruvate guanylyltransferase
MMMRLRGWRNSLLRRLMKTVLLPVKDFGDAKQRLAPVLSADSRSGLARAMLSDVLDALSACQVDRVVVYTASERVIRTVRPFGFEIVREWEVSGHSAAVNYMMPKLAETSDRIFAIAGDLPRLTAREIDDVFNAECEAITILPSRDGAGTNGMMFASPARIEMEYGPGSFARHMKRAASQGFQARVFEAPGIAFDIDTPEDLASFIDDPRLDGETWRFLSNLQSVAR